MSAAASRLLPRVVLLATVLLLGPLAPLRGTLAAFAAQTTSTGNAWTNLVVAPATQNPPTSLAGGVIHLSWSASSTASTETVSYAIRRSPAGAGTYTQVTTTTALSYDDTPPADGSYDYVIRTSVNTFFSDSAIRTALSDRIAPTAATSLVAKAGTATGSVNLTWTAGTDAGSGVAGYTVRFVQIATCPSATPANYPNTVSVGAVTATTVTGLVSAKNYCFYLTTVDGVGNQSGPSNVANVKAK